MAFKMSRKVMSNACGCTGNAYLATQHLMLPLSREVNRLVRKNMGGREQNLKILDVACGTGEPSATFAESFPNAQVGHY